MCVYIYIYIERERYTYTGTRKGSRAQAPPEAPRSRGSSRLVSDASKTRPKNNEENQIY